MYGDETQLHLSLPTSQRIRTYNEARSELRGAIARYEISARGFRKSGNQPAVTRETLPSALFERFPSLAVDAFGQTTFMHPSSPENIPLWENIVFEANEVRAHWAKPTPDIYNWLLERCQERPDEKKESRIADCCEAIGCTNREAKAAYKQLPQELQWRPGQKIRKRTN
jgi:hypothetical protein